MDVQTKHIFGHGFEYCRFFMFCLLKMEPTLSFVQYLHRKQNKLQNLKELRVATTQSTLETKPKKIPKNHSFT